MGFNEMVGGDRINLLLSKRFKIQGPPAPVMASEMFPVTVTENDRPEFHFLAQSHLWGATATDLGVVAQRSNSGVQNPVDSGVLVVVKRVWLSTDGIPDAVFDLRVELTNGGVTPDTVSATRFLDTRLGGSSTRVPVTQTVIFTTGGAQPGLSFFRGTTNASGMMNGDGTAVDVVLAPGSRLWATISGVNIGCVASFRGYERAAESGELQGSLA